jgi:hypothetical protein
MLKIFVYIILPLAIVIGYYIYANTRPKAKLFCPACGTLAVPKQARRGSLGVEVVLWLLLLVPGLIYSVWRLSGDTNTCPACGARTLIPADSPVAVRMLQGKK